MTMPSADPADRRPRGRWFQFSLRTLMAMVALCAIGLFLAQQYYWYRKKQILREWIDQVLAQDVSNDRQRAKPVPCPIALEDAEQIELLEFGVLNLDSSEHRTGALKLLVERFPAKTLPVLRRMLKRSAEPDFRALQLVLIGLHRDPATVDVVFEFLHDDPSPVVRAAAADAIGLIHCPAFRVPLTKVGWFDECSTVSSPTLDVGELVGLTGVPARKPNLRSIDEHLIDDVYPLPDSTREALGRMMLEGATDVERSAAARALLSWPPPDYALRVAEWGVWINDDGEFKLAQAVIDETPPFVHRIGNSAESLADRVNPIMIVTKPIIHLTVDQPMAVDVDVLVSQGRPWLAFPRPDDFSATVWMVQRPIPRRVFRAFMVEREGGQFDEEEEEEEWSNEPPIARFDRPDLAMLAPIREGYPWLSPAHRTSGGSHGVGFPVNQLCSLGLHWQSVIVSPERKAWMIPPTVDDDPRYGWWNDLREVPSSWVCNLGETERFLYYDGPTLLKPPLDIKYRDRTIEFAFLDEIPRDEMLNFTSSRNHVASVLDWRIEKRRAEGTRRGVFIRVEDGRPWGWVLSVERPTQTIALSQLDMLDGDALVRRFRELLTDAGLTEDEATGLYLAWKHQFFQTEGSRFLLFLTRDDYDAMCPLVVRPKPTEIARVGIVLTEFPAGAE
jgi:hypothetical protein